MDRRGLLKLIPALAAGAAVPRGALALVEPSPDPDPLVQAAVEEATAKLREQVEGLKAELIERTIEHALKSQRGHFLLMPYLRERCRLDESGRVVIDVDDLGGGEPMTVEDAVAALRRDDRFGSSFVALEPPGARSRSHCDSAHQNSHVNTAGEPEIPHGDSHGDVAHCDQITWRDEDGVRMINPTLARKLVEPE